MRDPANIKYEEANAALSLEVKQRKEGHITIEISMYVFHSK